VVKRPCAELAPHERGLVIAVLGGGGRDVAIADAVLEEARRLGVDPLDYCACRYGLGDAEVMRRAAHWAGYGFSPRVPNIAAGSPKITRLDGLAEIRTLRGVLKDRDVTFCAPRFDQLVALARARTNKPDMARHICIVPARAIRASLAESCTADLLTEARQRLTRRWPNASANIDLPISTRIVFVAVFSLATIAAVIAPFFLSELLLPIMVLLLLVPSALRLAAVVTPVEPPLQLRMLTDAELPVYTVLIPLRDEAGMVPLLHRAMASLDYPAEKLDIKFVVERKSVATIEAVQSILGDTRFELVQIPDAAPHTKPKALNYALPLARGLHVVVYDAEDIPDVNQLRLAASRFAADPSLDCIQAELVIDNAAENLITGLFAAEYAGQFGLMLPFLGRHRMPMPLGGTSNHFRTAALRELGHWDAFNVTEDADLGVRLSRLRYHTEMLRSETSEEAPITLQAWMVQRTRWIKGWMQTFIVHNRNAGLFLADIGWRNFVFFEIYVGGMILSSLLHTVFVVSLIVRGLVFGLWPGTTTPVEIAYLAILVFGYLGTVVLVIAGLVRRQCWELIPLQAALPFYWALHSIAAMRAAHQLIFRPYFWGKTTHGRTRRARTFAPLRATAVR
jgi:cellulose synthase/poly-beta-1,6-N-acetylglucosamine synthase-like glycosyltransferase